MTNQKKKKLQPEMRATKARQGCSGEVRPS